MLSSTNEKGFTHQTGSDELRGNGWSLKKNQEAGIKYLPQEHQPLTKASVLRQQQFVKFPL